MENIKIGYFRKISDREQSEIVSYQEYNDKSAAEKESLRKASESGRVRLYCACCAENELELMITKNWVIRVKSNGMQDLHKASCPKSEKYASYIVENESGVRFSEENGLCFNIAIPSGNKGSSGPTTSTPSEPDPNRKRAALLSMVSIINKFAWEKQTYSIKKSIAEANRQNEAPSWNYKDIYNFIRLFFGVTNEIAIQNGKKRFMLHDICYRSDIFFQAPYTDKFFIYAVIDKVSPVEMSRKYQYITLQMPSQLSSKKATVRVSTEQYIKMIGDFEEDTDLKGMILSGYVRHDEPYPGQKTPGDWITLLKGCIFRISSNGLYAETEYVSSLIDALAAERILFKRPYHALEYYGSLIPTIIIERLREKDIIIDVCTSTRDYNNKKAHFVENNPEFDVILVTEDTPIEAVIANLKKNKIWEK